MVVLGQKCLYSGKKVVFGQKWLYLGKEVFFGKSCIRAKVLVFGQIFRKSWLYSGKNGCIREKWFYSGKAVVFGQSGCFHKNGCIKTGKSCCSGCIRAKGVVFALKLLYSGKSCSIRAKVVVLGHKWLY